MFIRTVGRGRSIIEKRAMDSTLTFIWNAREIVLCAWALGAAIAIFHWGKTVLLWYFLISLGIVALLSIVGLYFAFRLLLLHVREIERKIEGGDHQ